METELASGLRLRGIVDRLDVADLRAGRAQNAYTRHLIAASQYQRA